MPPLLTRSPEGIYCPRGDFHVDPWAGVARAIVTHAHADHARPGSAGYLSSHEGETLLRARLGADAAIESLEWGATRHIGGVTVSLHPAGHIRGAAQVRVEADGEVWVVTGDYKRADDPTCTAFEPVRCHTLVSEATFALPVYRWEPTAVVMDDILAWWEVNRAQQRTSVLFCYALGKAQRILAELAGRTDRRAWVHGALDPLIACYRDAGVRMVGTDHVPSGRSARGGFAGELVLAPPSARGSTWMRRFADRSESMVSGWMRVRGERRRTACDRGFALSDHADWPALLATVADSGAQRVIATHGFAQPLARYLGERGLQTEVWPVHADGSNPLQREDA